jgi:hypothetical protein
MSTKKIGFKAYYIGVIFVFIFIYLLNKYIKNEALYKHQKVSNAYIYKINLGNVKSNNIVIKYYFFSDKKKYFGGIESGLNYKIEERLLNSYFPVIYDSLNPQNNVLLVDIERWNRLKLPLPDSLIWLKKYY